MPIPPLPSLPSYLALDSESRLRLHESIADALGHPWYSGELSSGTPSVVLSELAAPVDLETEVPEGPLFVLVPGGSFRPGLSDRERAVIDEWLAGDHADQDPEALSWCLEELIPLAALRPEVRIEPFLMAASTGPAALQNRVAELRDPTDAEWEWAVRAGGRTLFWWGDDPPPRIDEVEELPDGHPLGLTEIGWSVELCVGLDRSDDPTRSYRGGAGEYAPWQNTGELTCLFSAYRTRAVSGPEGHRFVLRL